MSHPARAEAAIHRGPSEVKIKAADPVGLKLSMKAICPISWSFSLFQDKERPEFADEAFFNTWHNPPPTSFEDAGDFITSK